jgi:2-octaprenyl-6-methoxyphenol hydroxylase
MSDQINTDVVIIGGGIAGLVMGILLVQKGVGVEMVEVAPPPPFEEIKISGRTAALFGGSIDLIKETGVWDRIAPICSPMQGMQIIDGETDVLFRADDIGLEQFGYNVPNMHLRTALFEAAQKQFRIHIASVKAFQPKAGHVGVNLDNGSIIKAALLIGADGRNSFVREHSGIAVKTKDYDQTALTFVINHDRAHNNISTEFHKPGGPLALVPMPGNQSSVVWVEKREDVSALLKLKKQDLTARLNALTHNHLGETEIVTAVQSWNLCLKTATSLTVPRTALIAEAAHVMPPISAQGLNLSLRDVRDLTGLIERYKRTGLDIGSSVLLKDYVKMRSPDIANRTKGVNLLNTVVMNNEHFVSKFKRAGLQAVDQLTPMKKQVMKHLMA